jgi:HAD superfamily hydrolase (TIGR01509 family)
VEDGVLHDSLTPVPPFSALIFDCDGTLVDTQSAHHRALKETLAAHGVTLDDAWYLARAGTSIRELLDELRAGSGHEFDQETVMSDRERRYVELAESLAEIEAVADVARAYHSRVPLAVASGGTRPAVEPVLRNLGLLGLFDAVVTYDDVERGKPAPDLFLLAAERLGTTPDGCIVYEDTDEGVTAARRAGMRVVDVRVARDSKGR